MPGAVASPLVVVVTTMILNGALLAHAAGQRKKTAGGGSTTATYKDSERLLREVIQPYDRRIRPIVNQSSAIDVFMTFHLLTLMEIDEIDQHIKLSAWVNFTWKDEIRPWDPSRYSGLSAVHPLPKDIWVPQVIVRNCLCHRDVFHEHYAPLALFSTGVTTWDPGAVLTLYCDLDMTFFPFDYQVCFVTFLGNDFSTSVQLKFNPEQDVDVEDYEPNGEWEYVRYWKRHQYPVYGTMSYCSLTVYLVFLRRPAYYVVNMLVPVMFMSYLTLFGFFIPSDSGERSTFSITVLLSMAVYMTVISGQIPATSYTFPLIVHYIFGLFMLSGVSVIALAVQFRMKKEWGLFTYRNTITTRFYRSLQKDLDRVRASMVGEFQEELAAASATSVSKQSTTKKEESGGAAMTGESLVPEVASESDTGITVELGTDGGNHRNYKKKGWLSRACRWAFGDEDMRLFLFFSAVWIGFSLIYLVQFTTQRQQEHLHEHRSHHNEHSH